MQYQENYVRPKPLAERMAESGLSDPAFVLDYYNTMSEYDPSIDGELTGEKYFKVKTVNVKTSYFEYMKQNQNYKAEKVVIIAELENKAGTYFKIELFNRLTKLDGSGNEVKWSDNSVRVQDFLEFAKAVKGADFMASVEYSTKYEHGDYFPHLAGVPIVVACAKVGENEYKGRISDKVHYEIFDKNGMSVPEISQGIKTRQDLKLTMESLYKEHCEFKGISSEKTIESAPVVEAEPPAQKFVDEADDNDIPF